MNEENDKHEFNFFLDKQIQLQLLEADEELSIKEKNCNSNNLKPPKNSVTVWPNGNNITSVKGNGSNPSAQKLFKDLQNIHICGWFPGANITYRKTETDLPSKSKGNALASNRELLMSRDSRNRTHEFVFRHYTDPRRYIEQYRREHVCYDTANSSATRNEFLDTRRFYAYNQYSPLAINLQTGTFQQSTTLSSAQQEMYIPSGDQQYQAQPQKQQGQGQSVQYPNRREQTKQTISANLRNNSSQHKYKLSKTAALKPSNGKTSEEVSESSEVPVSNDKMKRLGSAREKLSSANDNYNNTISVQKAQATKVNVPYSSNSSGTPARSFKSTHPGSNVDNSNSQKVGHGNSRTLESLACVAQNGAGKQLDNICGSTLQDEPTSVLPLGMKPTLTNSSLTVVARRLLITN